MASEIKELETLLQPSLGPTATILNVTTKRLTAAGENYGSLMLAVDIKVKNEKGNVEDLNLVTKMCPPNEFLKQAFNVNVSFRKEIAVYTIIFPTLKEFQKKRSASKRETQFLCNCYGARISLNPNSTVVDDDAVLVLENLKVLGFVTEDRMKGFNLETTRLLLKDLAVFHAIPVALRMMEPEIFKAKILPSLNRNDVFDCVSPESEKAIIDSIIETAKTCKECVPLLDRVRKRFTEGFVYLRKGVPISELFATISHNDFWVNNMMLKFENNNPARSKLVDFQIIDYGSPGKDVIFFLFSSVQKDVLNSHFDALLKLYYDTFIDTLRDLNCDVKSFTFDKYLEEIATAAKTTEFTHTLIMVRHVLALKGKVKEITEITMDDLTSEAQISEEFRQHIPYIILEFAKRGWI